VVGTLIGTAVLGFILSNWLHNRTRLRILRSLVFTAGRASRDSLWFKELKGGVWTWNLDDEVEDDEADAARPAQTVRGMWDAFKSEKQQKERQERVRVRVSLGWGLGLGLTGRRVVERVRVSPNPNPNPGARRVGRVQEREAAEGEAGEEEVHEEGGMGVAHRRQAGRRGAGVPRDGRHRTAAHHGVHVHAGKLLELPLALVPHR
jgi:hypothetical protein